ncbi:uncharacterized protein LOC129908889 isoform X1 [Episyrphus balteatus]|uniref:uncharacterized protein LOC129908889 isoform X1 n=1 Tax=Episyrphus balteatus TaxID=286459 RepID=UPI002485B077|nr:uncharacterized protein LOC129908889 isoform X1 [Episyrphus balteatus]
MPKYKKPPTLEDLALKASVVWLSNFGRKFMKNIRILSKNDAQKATEILKECLKTAHDIFEYNVPHYLFDRVGQEVFKTTPKLIDDVKSCLRASSSISEYLSQVNVAVGLAEVIISPYLRQLDFMEVPKMMRHMFYTKLSCMPGIQYLNLSSMSGGWKTSQMEPIVLNGLASMKNLRTLVLNYDCTDTILELLAKACPYLHTLDVCSSKSITNNSVKYLSNLSNLRVLQLYSTSVTIDGYATLFIKMPFLQDIGRFDDIGRCLEYVYMKYQSYEAKDIPQLQLRVFSSRFVVTKHLQILAEFCPEITTVLLFHNPLLNDLMALIAINKLSVLKLLSCDFFGDQVRDVLQVKGCNLTHLHLEHVDQLDMNALIYISQYCPDLKILTFYYCDFIESTSLYIRKLEIPPFMNLEKLTITSACFEQHMEFLMSNCFKIKTVHIGTMAPTTDALIDAILSKNPMEHLDSLNIAFSNGLSIRTAYKLVEVCPNLRMLGELGSWALINEFELECFKMFIATRNFDLDIQTFARYSGEPQDSEA